MLPWLPPVNGLPLGGYFSVGLLLLGSTLILPALGNHLARHLPTPRHPALLLGLFGLRAGSAQSALTQAGLFISFSLVVAMGIMVGSFRQSLDDWLQTLLPADIYLRAGTGSDTAYLSPREQQAIAEHPAVTKINFVRHRMILLAQGRPPVHLIARSVDFTGDYALPLVGPALKPDELVLPPAWISEAVQDLYGYRPGDRISLPLAGRLQEFQVAGIWRDYARQSGAIVIPRQHYLAMTSDENVNDVWLWLHRSPVADDLAGLLRLFPEHSLDLVTPGAIRSLSLSTFDRTFAVTYAMEAVAILVGLFSVSASFSGMTLARRCEFGMLRHVGMTRGQIAAMLAWESAALAGTAILLGVPSGLAISQVLIHVVNRQSFHWSMDVHVPSLPLVLFALALLALAVITAVISSRSALSGEAVRAVKEDW